MTTLARHANPKFNETGLTGSTIDALLSGYEPLRTIPGCMTGFARSRANGVDSRFSTLNLPYDKRFPNVTRPVKVRLGDQPNSLLGPLRTNLDAPIIATCVSKPPCLGL